ncbi:MAG: O-methyltransferase [Anaerolineales bacterium]|jgi:predicted O-methyltransferase YrrM
MPTYNDALEKYSRELFAQEDAILQTIRRRIAENGLPQITVKPEEGRFLQFITSLGGVRKALEIGTLGGYSGTWIARGLASGGMLITLEREQERAELAREHFKLAGVADRVSVRVGDAHQLLESLAPEGPFDLIFIDAEKEGYLRYLDWALVNIAPGGLVAGHNAFSHGDVVDSDIQTERAHVLRQFNQRLAQDQRLVSLIYPAGDGLAVGYLKKEQS